MKFLIFSHQRIFYFCMMRSHRSPNGVAPSSLILTAITINPLAHVDYHYAVYFTAVIDAVFSGKGDNTLTKDTGLDYLLLALLDKPASLHSLIPTPDKKSSTGHVWAYHKIQRILASPPLRRVFDPDANQFKLNAQRVVIAHLDRSDLEEFDALLLGLLLIGQYHGQVCIPDLGFYGRDAHTRLVRQKRLKSPLNPETQHV